MCFVFLFPDIRIHFLFITNLKTPICRVSLRKHVAKRPLWRYRGIILKQIFRKQVQKAWTVGAEVRDKGRAIVNVVTDFRAA